MNKFLLLIFAAVFFGCSQPKYKNPHVLINSSVGDIEVELFPDKAPKTVAAFLSYVDSGFYVNSSFYRVVIQEGLSSASNTGIVQGGIYQTSDRQHPSVPGIPHETTKESGLSHTSGTVSLARLAPGTGNTEFFICVGDQTQFDYGNLVGNDTVGYAAFGKVITGMPAVRKIQGEPKHGENLDNRVTIKNITRL